MDVAIVCQPVHEWVTPFREHSDRHVYVIASLEHPSGREVREAWQMGVDDIMSAKASPEEVAGRVDAVERIRSWVHTMGDDFVRVPPNTLSRLTTLTEFPIMICSEFGQMIGADLVSEPLEMVPNLEYAAEIPLTLISDGLNLTIGVGLLKDAVPTFCGVLFGDIVGHDVMADAMREFANMAGGTIKRGADAEGHTFSLGLPADAMFVKPASDARVWRLVSGDLELCVWLITRQDARERLSASLLREGMVISKAVNNGAGVMLIPEGTVLTERTVARLLQLLGPSTLVEVARAA